MALPKAATDHAARFEVPLAIVVLPAFRCGFLFVGIPPTPIAAKFSLNIAITRCFVLPPQFFAAFVGTSCLPSTRMESAAAYYAMAYRSAQSATVILIAPLKFMRTLIAAGFLFAMRSEYRTTDYAFPHLRRNITPFVPFAGRAASIGLCARFGACEGVDARSKRRAAYTALPIRQLAARLDVVRAFPL